jgi:hypothetical protein
MSTFTETVMVNYRLSVADKRRFCFPLTENKWKLAFSISSVVRLRNSGNVETWTYIETWRHEDVEMEAWKHGDGGMEIWRHGDIKRKPENVSPGVLYTTKTSSFYESRK